MEFLFQPTAGSSGEARARKRFGVTEKRSVEDRLREEYFELLPEVRRVVEELESKVKYALLPTHRELNEYERLVVKSRIKECDSAIDSLRRRQEGGTFDRDRPWDYTLTHLNDLAGVRVLASSCPGSIRSCADDLHTGNPTTSWRTSTF
jgi:ppGpp synthetase/RelA/SpoT-type nucleotidyltranferase